MSRVTVVQGGGEFGDQWHDFAATSRELAGVLRAAGHQVDVATDARRVLDEGAECDLLVLNLSGIPTPVDERREDLSRHPGLFGHLEAGRPLLAVHGTILALGDVADWPAVVGGTWVAGRSWHPPIGFAQLELVGDLLGPAVQSFSVWDERYTDLEVRADVEVVLEHSEGGRGHPLVWAHRYRSAPVLYTALGHDVESYRSAGQRALLAAAVDWLLGRTGSEDPQARG